MNSGRRLFRLSPGTVALLLFAAACSRVQVQPNAVGGAQSAADAASSSTVQSVTSTTVSNSAARFFQSSKNSVLDPNGNSFTVKGVSMFDYLFAGDASNPSTMGMVSWQNRNQFLSEAQSMGMNLIRVFVSPDNNNPTDLGRLNQVIQMANAKNMVVELTNCCDTFSANLAWVQVLAATYKSNPYVWISPANEINCGTFANRNLTENRSPLSTVDCMNSSVWQSQMQQYVTAIRATGFKSPIVLNGRGWSADLRLMLPYLPSDSNLVLGVHRYANANTTFSASEQAAVDAQWGNIQSPWPVLLEEVGNNNDAPGATGPQPAWSVGMMQYATRWVLERGGLGAIGFSWYSVGDQNAFVDANGNLSLWGSEFKAHYLNALLPVSLPQTAWQQIATGDFFGSGTSQILLRGGGTFQIVTMQGSYVVGGQPVVDQGTGTPLNIPQSSYQDLAVGDFYGIGKSQILLRGGGSLQIITLDGANVVNSATVVDAASGSAVNFPASQYQNITTGDFSGNGHSQILLRGGGYFQILNLKGNIFTGGQTVVDAQTGSPLSVPASEYQDFITGDFLGTGRSQILLRGGGSMQLLTLDANVFTGGMTLTDGSGEPLNLPSSAYQDLLSGNFYGTGSSQILLRGGGFLQILTLLGSTLEYGRTATPLP